MLPAVKNLLQRLAREELGKEGGNAPRVFFESLLERLAKNLLFASDADFIKCADYRSGKWETLEAKDI